MSSIGNFNVLRSSRSIGVSITYCVGVRPILVMLDCQVGYSTRHILLVIGPFVLHEYLHFDYGIQIRLAVVGIDCASSSFTNTFGTTENVTDRV